MLLTVALVAAQVSQATPIMLTCSGGGSANKPDGASATFSDNRGYNGTATMRSQRSEGFEDQVDIEISNDVGRIRLPRMMLPAIHGGDAGWFKLKNVKITEGTIVASAAVNALNNPKIHIDRRTGSISIDGKSGHYRASCERALIGAPTKF